LLSIDVRNRFLKVLNCNLAYFDKRLLVTEQMWFYTTAYVCCCLIGVLASCVWFLF